MLTAEEILLILEKLADGKMGYSDDPKVGALQAKLSIMLSLARARVARGG
jgi:hypothetical protein